MHMLPATRCGIDNDSYSAVRTNLRIGFLSTKDPNNPDALSSMPHRMQSILEARVLPRYRPRLPSGMFLIAEHPTRLMRSSVVRGMGSNAQVGHSWTGSLLRTPSIHRIHLPTCLGAATKTPPDAPSSGRRARVVPLSVRSDGPGVVYTVDPRSIEYKNVLTSKQTRQHRNTRP